MGAFEDGTSFLAGVLAKIPADLRSQVQAVFEKPEVKDAVILVGDGVLARSDYSKHMDDLKKQGEAAKAKLDEATALYTKNQEWYTKNEAALKEYPTLKTKLAALEQGGDGNGEGDHRPPPVLDKDAIQQLVDSTLTERERSYVDVVAFMQDTGFTHHQLFGEPLNMRELVGNPKLGKPIAGQPGRVFSLQDAYNEKFGEKVAAKHKEAEDKRINDEVEKRLAEKLKSSIGQPFPLRGGPGPSVLDVLDTKEGAAAHTLDTAVAEYERLQATRTS
jgi:hypothetical protein